MVRGKKKEFLFNGLIGEFHYLGYHQGNGQQLKYIVYSEDRIIAAIGFAAAAYKWDRQKDELVMTVILKSKRRLKIFMFIP